MVQFSTARPSCFANFPWKCSLTHPLNYSFFIGIHQILVNFNSFLTQIRVDYSNEAKKSTEKTLFYMPIHRFLRSLNHHFQRRPVLAKSQAFTKPNSRSLTKPRNHERLRSHDSLRRKKIFRHRIRASLRRGFSEIENLNLEVWAVG